MQLSELSRATKENAIPEEIDAAVNDLFAYHPWTGKQVEQGCAVRNALGEAYKVILFNVPSCPNRTRALNMLTDARMLANTAITFNGQV